MSKQFQYSKYGLGLLLQRIEPDTGGRTRVEMKRTNPQDMPYSLD